ncbi:MAG: T9SS type A sorting domain-containing protein [Chitinophagaceae bacterium]
MRKNTVTLFFFLFVFFFSVQVSLAQPNQEVIGIPTTGVRGITVSVTELMRRAEIADKAPRPAVIKFREEFHSNRHPVDNPAAQNVSQWPPDNTRNNLTQRVAATQTIHSNFLGIDLFSESSSIPPDSNGDVSSTQVCVISNGRIKFYNRNTVCDAAQTTAATGATPLASPVFSSDLDAFFLSVAPNGTSDPHVRYDRLSNRWFIVAIDLAAASNPCVIAMSSGPTITGAASFTFFSFVYDAISSPPAVPAGYIGGFFDYPTLGVDANALYIGGRMFTTGGTYLGASLFVVRKNSLTSGGPIVTTAFHLAGTNTTGTYTPQGVDNDDPAATQGYFVGVDVGVFSRLIFQRISTPGGTPTSSGTINLTVSTTTYPLGQSGNAQPALGTPATGLDDLDDRLFAAMIRKNKITGISSLWTAHNMEVNTSGVASSSGNRNGTRWYQIDNLAATPTVTQSGTLFDNAASNPRSFFIPSIAASGQGHSIVGFSTASVAVSADCGIAGRYRTDVSGTLQTFTLATTSTTAYNQAGSPERWGDYSQVVVDPQDDMTMWAFQEFCNATNSWGVRAIQVKAPPPATPIAPGTLGCGNPSGANRSSSVTLNGTSVSNSEFYDPGTGYTNRLAVTTTGTGASISNLVFVSPTQITFNVIWPSALFGSTQTLTITNPDCQSVTTTYTLPSSCSALPVHWLTFTGRDIGRRVQLNWVTDFEADNTHFNIERQNVRGEWISLVTQNSKGVNGGTYTEIDDNPLPVNFYRLKQVNVDGSFTYSVIVKVEIKSHGSFIVYPNPVKDQLNVEFPEAYRKGIIRLINSVGEVVYSVRINSDNKHAVDVNNFSTGNYVVEVESPTGSKQHSLVLIQRKEPKP